MVFQHLDKDEFIPKFKKLVDMVHKNGEKYFYAISSFRLNTKSKSKMIYSPSSLPIPDQNKKLKQITKEDILPIENNFSKDALRANKDGFDGVEIYWGHFYLVREFLSSLYNIRNYEYAGNVENTVWFLEEIMRKRK